MPSYLTSIASHVTMRLAALRRALASRDLRRLQASSLANSTVEYAVIVALSVWAFDRGGAAAVGVITVIRTLPALLSGPLLSVVADRGSRVRVLTVGFALRTTTIVALAAATANDSLATMVYVLAALDAVAASMFYPAYGALLPELAGSPDDLAAANAMSSATENVGMISGPAMAGGILVAAGPAAVFAVSGAIVAGATAVVAPLRSDRRTPSQRGATSSFLGELGVGIAAVRRNPGSGLVVGSWAFESVLVGMAEVFVVVVAFELIDWGDPGVGWLNAVLGFGGLAGSIAMAALARSRPFGRYLALGITLFGVSLAAASVPLVLVVLVAHWTMGIAAAQVDVAAMTLLQRTVPDNELGRVFGVFEGIYWGALGVGAALASWTVVAFELQPALLATGIAGTLIGLAILPRMHRVDTLVGVPETRLELLRQIPIFAALPVPTRERLARRMVERNIAAGAELIREGDTDNSIYVVESGELVVTHGEQRVATLQPANVVGEIAAMRNTPRTATVVARTAATVLQLDAVAFIEAVSGHAVAETEADTLVDTRIGQLRRMRFRTGR